MKKIGVVIIAFICAINVIAQDSKFSVELGYPVPVGDNFVQQGYNGIIDIGADYRIIQKSFIHVGVSFNGSILSNASTGFQEPKVTLYAIQPRVFGELNLVSAKKIHPMLGLGYSILLFDAKMASRFETVNTTITERGINVNLGAAYDITQKLFAQVQYDFSKLQPDNGVPDNSFNRNVNMLKIGLGYRF